MDKSNSKDRPLIAESVPGDIPVIAVSSLLLHGREAVLVHGPDRYRLRITAKGKLILTK